MTFNCVIGLEPRQEQRWWEVWKLFRKNNTPVAKQPSTHSPIRSPIKKLKGPSREEISQQIQKVRNKQAYLQQFGKKARPRP